MSSSPQELRFPTANGTGDVRGIVHLPASEPKGGLVIAHGRSNDMKNPLVRRIAEDASEAGLLALRFNFRYVDAKKQASRDLSVEEDDLRGAARFAHQTVSAVFVAGKSMGARVCARASGDPDVAGMIALGYPLHPMFKPQVRNPPEWSMIVKPALFVQGDQDPFCDLSRLQEDLPRLRQEHEFVVIPRAGHSFESKGEKRDTFPEVWRAVLDWLSGHLSSG